MTTARIYRGGFSLTELMVALTLGGLLIAAALKLHSNALAAWLTAENLADLEERGAFALTMLADDLRLAGFWGRHSDPGLIEKPAGVSARCGGGDATDWVLAVERPVETGDDANITPCVMNRQPGSDVLVTRHASATVTSGDAGYLRVHTNHSRGTLYTDAVPAEPADGESYGVEVHGWYVSRTSSEAGLPALRRYALVRNGLLQNQEIMPGIEDLQVMLGIDSDGDTRLDAFVTPGMTGAAPVVAVSLWLLLRTAQPEPGHIDTGPWLAPGAAPADAYRPNDSFRRTTLRRTIYLRNGPAP